jgi:hypothetical protein
MGADAAPVDPGACFATSAQAEAARAPVDIIWAIDTSGSMDEEADTVEDELNDFSTFIEGAGIDHRVVLIGDAVDVQPPLGGGPRFRHVNQHVGSTNALELIVSTYPQYQDFLRSDAVKHLVVVTDDESAWSAGQFNSQLAMLGAPGMTDYTFHAVCSEEAVLFSPPPPFPTVTGACTGGLGGGDAKNPGLTYIDMVEATGGVWHSICTSDWAPIFDAVAEAVTISSTLPCAYDIPPPPQGQSLDPELVNLAFTPSGSTTELIPQVASAGACSGEGWYYDNAAAPTRILVCPATCGQFGGTGGSVDIQFGCQTIVD